MSDDDLGAAIDAGAESTGFAGVVRVDRPRAEPLVKAIGLADRGHGIAHTEATWLAMASGSKGLTSPGPHLGHRRLPRRGRRRRHQRLRAGPGGARARRHRGLRAFLRTDELPGEAALGYLHADGLRTNVFHLPVRGNGDGGAFATVAGIHAFWDAFTGGDIVSAEHVATMTQPRHDVPSEGKRYGLGFWVHATTDAVLLEGYDAGVSFQSGHDAARGWTWTVMANTSEGAWPMARLLGEAYSNQIGAVTAE